MSRIDARTLVAEKKAIIYNKDCIELMREWSNGSVDTVLTDIPYDGVNDNDTGKPVGMQKIRQIGRGFADELTFDLNTFLLNVDRLATQNVIIFCGQGQVSTIYNYFQKKKNGTARTLVWQKSNPSPFNGQHIYLSGIELAVWYKKPKGTFNAFCKNTVFRHPIGSGKLHPTEKNHKLLTELILDNTNEDAIIFDPCAGSFSTGLVALENNRRFIGNDLNEDCYKLGLERLGLWL